MTRETLPPGYFDAVYAARDDPWDLESSAYEADKYEQTMRALAGRRFHRGFEIGCSIGVLTEMLAASCDALLAVDASEAPLPRARERCAGLEQVRFERMQVPAEFPTGRFDLVVTSEVAYYWSPDDLALACRRIESALEAGGWWLLVHWTPPVHDYPLTGDEVHDFVRGRSGDDAPLRHVTGRREARYRLDLFGKRH